MPIRTVAPLPLGLAGARERLSDDDALMAEMATVLDSLCAHFLREAQRGTEQGRPAMSDSPIAAVTMPRAPAGQSRERAVLNRR